MKKVSLIGFNPDPDRFTLRLEQEQILEDLDRNWSAYDDFIIDAPVGVGKSLIAIALAKFSGSAHILTPKISLQRQYLESFGESVGAVAGRGNYPCIFDSTRNEIDAIEKEIMLGGIPNNIPTRISCASSARRCSDEQKGKEGASQCLSKTGAICPYNLAIEAAQGFPIIVHNFMSFFYQAGLLQKHMEKSLVIVDEAHALEDSARAFGTRSVKLSEEEGNLFRDAIIGIDSENGSADLSAMDEVISAINEARAARELPPGVELPPLKTLGNSPQAVSLLPAKSGYSLRAVPRETGGIIDAYIKPFGEKRVYMTGSIASLSYLKRRLGLDKVDACHVQVSKSPFPTERRKILFNFRTTCNMSAGNKGRNMDGLVSSIEAILNKHAAHRGVIHTKSYENSRTLKERLDSDRIIVPDSYNHRQLFQKFIEAGGEGGNSVFLSPAISEGVDLKYDKARFQIIISGDYIFKSGIYASMGHDEFKKLLRVLVGNSFMQQVGRVMRAQDDWGFTYVLDRRLPLTLASLPSLPEWLTDAMEFKMAAGEALTFNEFRGKLMQFGKSVWPKI